jgi:hypothetical protein
MSFDTDKMHKLRGKGFEQLYKKNPAKWNEIVGKARDYAKTWVGTNEKIHHGDVVSALMNAVRIEPDFEAFVKKERLPQKYWIAWFAEYLVEQIYPQAEPTSK